MYETSNVGKYQPVVIGIDHGFSQIKTYHHIMSNGVARISGKPPVLENSLYYDGNYYVICGSRMTVNEDKTENDNYFILTLAAIAKELKTRGIEKFAKVVLGVGVPFKRFMDYYNVNYTEILCRDKGEQYSDLVERICPDILIEDDCASIGGEKEWCITNVKEDIRKNIKLMIVKEFQGIDSIEKELLSSD